MLDLLIATSNPGKLREYAELFATLPALLLYLRDVGLDTMHVEEDAGTFEGNAELKALAYAKAARLITLADDSGLVVDALDGLPGVETARYAGPGASDRDRYMKLLRAMNGLPDEQRRARFICVITVVDPQRMDPISARGTVEGRIAHAPDEGEYGFGFDPVFIPDGYDVALSSIPVHEKNRISHRGRAAAQILPVLQQMAQERGE
jgi:XTP/dITP diphosphohydrolase